MDFIRYFGDLLSKKIKLSSPAARGLLKLAIADELGPFFQRNKINYNDLKKIFEKSLRIRITKLESSKIDEIIQYLIEELEHFRGL
jgi:hypothetical protein